MVSCRSNNVRPQLGHDIYSVLEILDLVACRIPNDKDTILSKGVAGESIQTPDPKPSIKSAPKSVAAYN
ncbi:hypothetical protein D3C75_1354110 [compost metagenome]